MPKTAKFDAAIVTLEGELPCLPTAEDIGWQERYYALKPTSKEFYGDIQAAIRVLKDWPKWEPLIEAAGNLRRGSCLMFMDDIELPIPPRVLDYKKVGDGIRALLEALPGKEKL